MPRKWLLPILVLFVVYVFSSQGLKGGPEISVQQTANLMKGEPRPVLIDLRERAEYDQGHIAGAMSVPQAEFKNQMESLKLPKADAIVLYGNNDDRTREATKHLYASGYLGGLTLIGGIEAWRAAGLQLEKTVAAKP